MSEVVDFDEERRKRRGESTDVTPEDSIREQIQALLGDDEDDSDAIQSGRFKESQSNAKQAALEAALESLSITGSTAMGNGVGNTVIVTGTVNVVSNTRPPRRKPAPTDAEFIDPATIKRLHELKDEIVALELDTDKQMVARKVWKTLTGAMHVASMRQIPATKSAAAESYLKGWVSRLKRDEVRHEIREAVSSTEQMAKLEAYVADHWPGKTLDTLPSMDALTRTRRFLAVLKKQAD